jgi:hypothetical protein
MIRICGGFFLASPMSSCPREMRLSCQATAMSGKYFKRAGQKVSAALRQEKRAINKVVANPKDGRTVPSWFEQEGHKFKGISSRSQKSHVIMRSETN